MQQPSPIKSIISGSVGGMLGASLAAGALAILGVAGNLTYQNLLWVIGVGEVIGIVLAFVYPKLPKSFIAKSILGVVGFVGGLWVVAFPQIGLPFSGQLAVVSIVASIAYGVMVTFVLGQAIGLALPLVPMGRRAEEFNDNPSGA